VEKKGKEEKHDRILLTMSPPMWEDMKGPLGLKRRELSKTSATGQPWGMIE